MAQNWTDNCFDLDNSGHIDLTSIENNFACLLSMFSGGNAPSSPVVGMPWFNTTYGILKIRNADNNGWLGVFTGTINQKCIFYRDDAEEGWIVDNTNTDKVIGIKSVSGPTYTVGGVTAGSWVISGLVATFQHTHSQEHYHAGVSGEYPHGSHTHAVAAGSDYFEGAYRPYACGDSAHTHTSSWNTNITGNANTLTVLSSGIWRPAACVNTVQYMDI